MEEVSAEIVRFATPLRHPSALPLLVALEAKPRGQSELAQLLGIEHRAAEYLVEMLIKSGLVERVHLEPADGLGRTTRWIYGTCHDGWSGVVQAFANLKARPSNS